VTVTSANAVNDNNWHLLVGTLNSSYNTLSLYVDGVLQGTADASGAPAFGFTGYFRFGGYKTYYWPNSTDGFFSGLIDEVRVSNTNRSGDWILTEYNNQSAPSSFMTIGPNQ